MDKYKRHLYHCAFTFSVRYSPKHHSFYDYALGFADSLIGSGSIEVSADKFASDALQVYYEIRYIES